MGKTGVSLVLDPSCAIPRVPRFAPRGEGCGVAGLRRGVTHAILPEDSIRWGV